MPTRISGTNSASTGVWRPTIAPRSSLGRPVISASVMIGIAIAPKATGAVFATSATDGGLDRREAERDEHHGRDRHRRAEAGERLEQGAEAERDDHGLDALVVRDPTERPPQHREVPGRLGHVVDPERVPDDPHDREQPEHGAEQRAVDRLAEGHGVHRDGDDERHEQCSDRRLVGLALEAAEQDEERQQRKRGEDRCESERFTDGVVHLLVHTKPPKGRVPPRRRLPSTCGLQPTLFRVLTRTGCAVSPTAGGRCSIDFE